jgi:hypothetical protein
MVVVLYFIYYIKAMNLYNALVLLTAVLWASSSGSDPVVSPVTFDNLVHKVDYAVPSGLNAMLFETDGEVAFVVPEDRFTILKYDIASGELLDSVGREGEGPGEFSDKILRISVIDRHVYAFSGRTIHIFDKDLKYVDRHVTKYMAMGISRLIDGNHVLCTMMVGDIPEPKSSYNMTVVKQHKFDQPDHTMFRLGTEMENHGLSQCHIAANKTMVAATQIGARNVRFHNMAGEMRKRVPVNLAQKELQYLNIYQPEVVTNIYKNMGYTDFRVPVGMHISNVQMGETYTMVQGGTSAEHVMRSVAIIEHGTWRVHYDVLPAECGNFRLVEDRMICMVSHEQSRYFAVYEL